MLAGKEFRYHNIIFSDMSFQLSTWKPYPSKGCICSFVKPFYNSEETDYWDFLVNRQGMCGARSTLRMTRLKSNIRVPSFNSHETFSWPSCVSFSLFFLSWTLSELSFSKFSNYIITSIYESWTNNCWACIWKKTRYCQ